MNLTITIDPDNRSEIAAAIAHLRRLLATGDGTDDVNCEVFKHAISVLDLSVRTRNCLRYREPAVEFVGELTEVTADDLLELRNFGHASLCEVRNELAVHGLRLKGEPAPQSAKDLEPRRVE